MKCPMMFFNRIEDNCIGDECQWWCPKMQQLEKDGEWSVVGGEGWCAVKDIACSLSDLLIYSPY